MNTKLATRTMACCAIAAAGACATVTQAQTASQTGALSLFVNDPRSAATGLQQQAGYAVQGMCTSLAAEGGLRLTGAKQDLFARCNEMVETARVFQGIPAGTGRNLGYSDRSQLLAAVQQVSGEELAAQGTMSTQVSSGQFSNIGGRLTALRMGTARQRFGGGASSDEQALSAESKKWGWFVESSYGFGDQDQTVAVDAFDYDSVSVTTGADYNFGSGVLGFSLGYDNYKADFDHAVFVSGGDVEVKGVSGSVFGGYFGERWTVSGIGTYGSLSSDVSRRVVYDSANAACNPSCGAVRTMTGSPDGSYIALGLTVGYDFHLGGWDLTPSLSGSYRDVDVDGYSETDQAGGGLALRYDDQTIKSTRSIVGLALSRPISRDFGVLVPSLRAEWHHEFEDSARTIRAKYVLEDSLALGASDPKNFSCSISCFSMLTDQVDADFGVASIGLSAVFPRRLQAYLVYEALLGTSNVSGNSIAAGLRGQF
ncbi:autotransporter outer membrane beta-barrel domain-containing protein [Peristeroidobacter soli]|uniref:autotransporter outer membrane beta-barrel domain-containing protein n=1 Tax=Peristeroidobacter soli TaxID=2497877 RepID=UPI00101CED98|nr:autotransporter outer membrane beta-barrel domain-containing protein [Peristeroidobacter soli]